MQGRTKKERKIEAKIGKGERKKGARDSVRPRDAGSDDAHEDGGTRDVSRSDT